MKTYDIVIRLADKREMRFRLDTQYAPITVEHFVEVARSGHYEGAIFHRVIRDFMIQTGGYCIKDMPFPQPNNLHFCDKLPCLLFHGKIHQSTM